MSQGNPVSQAQRFLTSPQAHTAAVHTWQSHTIHCSLLCPVEQQDDPALLGTGLLSQAAPSTGALSSPSNGVFSLMFGMG